MDTSISINQGLIDSIISNHSALVEYFLIAGADPNYCEDLSKIQPLHFAVSFGAFDCVDLLLDAGADWLAKNDSGESPLHLIYNVYIRPLLISIYRFIFY